jgi:hypothetical protein
MKHGNKVKKLGLLALLSGAVIIGCSTGDILPPVPGNGGTLLFAGVSGTEAEVIWTEAVDVNSGQALLEYKLVYSGSPNLETPENAETNGTVVTDWTADTASGAVTGLLPETDYYFNVIVRDESGNMAVYLMGSLRTADGTAPDPGEEGSLTVTDITKHTVSLEWDTGRDDESPPYALEYKVVYSDEDNINTVTGAETNGTAVVEWAADIDSVVVDGLSEGTEYFFNVLVRDSTMNTAVYESTSAVTLQASLILSNYLEREITQISLDGTVEKIIYEKSDITSFPLGIAVDNTNRTLYWTDPSDKIMKGNLDGTDIDVLIEGSEVDYPIYIEVWEEEDKIFWLNRTDVSLKWADLDGTYLNVVTSADRLDQAWDTVLDKNNHVIYWTNFGTINGIFKLDLKEAVLEIVLTVPEEPYALELDPEAGILYWGDDAGNIKSVKTDGTDVQTLNSGELSDPYGFALHEGILYVADGSLNKLFSYDISEDTLTELLDGLNLPFDIVIYNPE